MAKYSALKLAKDKVKKLTDDNTRLRIIVGDLRMGNKNLNESLIESQKHTNILSNELRDIRNTFRKQSDTLKLAGDTIRELQRSRKRLKLIVRVLVVTLVTIVTVGAFTL